MYMEVLSFKSYYGKDIAHTSISIEPTYWTGDWTIPPTWKETNQQRQLKLKLTTLRTSKHIKQPVII